MLSIHSAPIPVLSETDKQERSQRLAKLKQQRLREKQEKRRRDEEEQVRLVESIMMDLDRRDGRIGRSSLRPHLQFGLFDQTTHMKSDSLIKDEEEEEDKPPQLVTILDSLRFDDFFCNLPTILESMKPDRRMDWAEIHSSRIDKRRRKDSVKLKKTQDSSSAGVDSITVIRSDGAETTTVSSSSSTTTTTTSGESTSAESETIESDKSSVSEISKIMETKKIAEESPNDRDGGIIDMTPAVLPLSEQSETITADDTAATSSSMTRMRSSSEMSDDLSRAVDSVLAMIDDSVMEDDDESGDERTGVSPSPADSTMDTSRITTDEEEDHTEDAEVKSVAGSHGSLDDLDEFEVEESDDSSSGTDTVLAAVKEAERASVKNWSNLLSKWRKRIGYTFRSDCIGKDPIIQAEREEKAADILISEGSEEYLLLRPESATMTVDDDHPPVSHPSSVSPSGSSSSSSSSLSSIRIQSGELRGWLDLNEYVGMPQCLFMEEASQTDDEHAKLSDLIKVAVSLMKQNNRLPLVLRPVAWIHLSGADEWIVKHNAKMRLNPTLNRKYYGSYYHFLYSTSLQYWDEKREEQQNHQQHHYKKESMMKPRSEMEEFMHRIDKDVHRTFGDDEQYWSKHGSRECLRRVLMAYAIYDSELGYCQGMNYIAALILHVCCNEEEAFWLFTCMMCSHRFYLRSLFLTDLIGYRITQSSVAKLLNNHLPDLYQHLCRNPEFACSSGLAREHSSLNTDEYSISIVLNPLLHSIFSYPNLTDHISTTERIYDLLLLSDFRFVIRLVFAVFFYYQSVLLKIDEFTKLVTFFKSSHFAINDSIVSLALKLLFTVDEDSLSSSDSHSQSMESSDISEKKKRISEKKRRRRSSSKYSGRMIVDSLIGTEFRTLCLAGRSGTVERMASLYRACDKERKAMRQSEMDKRSEHKSSETSETKPPASSTTAETSSSSHLTSFWDSSAKLEPLTDFELFLQDSTDFRFTKFSLS